MVGSTQEKIKHLEFIQDVITRMNSNSFAIKRWALIILAAILTAYIAESNMVFLVIALAGLLTFWLLDAFYLKQERMYRGLYSAVIKGDANNFDMDATKYPVSYLAVIFSKTLLIMYLPFSIVAIFIIFYELISRVC